MKPYACARSASLRANISAEIDHYAALLPGRVVLHLAVDHVHAAAVGDRLDYLTCESDLVRVGQKTRLAMSIWTGCSDQRADAAHQERGAELRLAARDVADVAERPVEREDAGRRARVDHAPERVVPQVLLGARTRRLGVVRDPGRRARDSRDGRRRRAWSSSGARPRGRPARCSSPASAGSPPRSPRRSRRRAPSRGSRARGSGASPRPSPRAGRAGGRRSGCPTAPRPSGP